MAELNLGDMDDEFNIDLFETIKAKGKPVRFSEEDMQKSNERYAAFCEGKLIGKIEAGVREEQAAAVSAPLVYLTF
jgi:hypothetical protein